MQLTADDKFAIQELLFRAYRLMENHDVDEWVNCFAEDASLILTRYGQFASHPEIRGWMVNHLDAGLEDDVQHFATNITIAQVEDEVRVKSRVLKATTERPPRLISAGVWEDKVVRIEDRWKFAERKLDNGPPEAQ